MNASNVSSAPLVVLEARKVGSLHRAKMLRRGGICDKLLLDKGERVKVRRAKARKKTWPSAYEALAWFRGNNIATVVARNKILAAADEPVVGAASAERIPSSRSRLRGGRSSGRHRQRG